MAKVYKLKKQARYGIIGVILLIIVLLVARAIYKDYVYKNSYEYKLEIHGYNEKEVKQLIALKDEERLEKLLKSPIDETLIAILDQKYFIRKNLDRYLAYQEDNKKTPLEDVIALVNVNADYEYYEHDLKSDVSLDEKLICNKYYKLDKDYEPDDLVEWNSKYYYGEAQVTRQAVYDAFIDMWNAANKEGFYLIANSSYRKYEEQEEVYNSYKENLGEAGADSIASRPGYSEHQTGLAIDVFSKDNTSTKTFKDSMAYQWLINNCYKYGFILRYPEGKENLTGYSFEAWHYRYVGKKIAKDIHDKNLTYEEYYAYYIDK